MKRLLFILLALMFSLCFASCAASDPSAQESEGFHGLDQSVLDENSETKESADPETELPITAEDSETKASIDPETELPITDTSGETEAATVSETKSPITTKGEETKVPVVPETEPPVTTASSETETPNGSAGGSQNENSGTGGIPPLRISFSSFDEMAAMYAFIGETDYDLINRSLKEQGYNGNANFYTMMMLTDMNDALGTDIPIFSLNAALEQSKNMGYRIIYYPDTDQLLINYFVRTDDMPVKYIAQISTKPVTNDSDVSKTNLREELRKIGGYDINVYQPASGESRSLLAQYATDKFVSSLYSYNDNAKKYGIDPLSMLQATPLGELLKPNDIEDNLDQ